MSKKNGEKSGEPRARVVENGGERPSTPTSRVPPRAASRKSGRENGYSLGPREVGTS